MLLDQIHVKTIELENEIKQLIQDLVMANMGSVSSTLLPIKRLIEIVTTAKAEWNFQPFFEISNVAMYYPLLTSYLNGSSVIIDIPFSSELIYHVYKFIPFPMNLNGSILSVDTKMLDPQYYILSVDNLKESKITNDDLQLDNRTNLDLYLCPSKIFTLNESLIDSCPASLVKNITIFKHCQFREMRSEPHHENVHYAHYLYFSNRTTVSVLCPNFHPRVASIVGLYRIPDQCELHSDKLTTIADRKKTVTLEKKKFLLIDIDVTLPKSSPSLKINEIVKRKANVNVIEKELGWKGYILMIIPMLLFTAIGIGIMYYVYRKMNTQRIVKHVSAMP